MKILKGLDEEIKTFNGFPITAAFIGEKPLTYRTAVVAICELYKSQIPGSGDAIRAFNIGVKFQASTNEIELSDENFAFLKELIDKSDIFIAGVIGRVSTWLGDIPKVDDNKEGKGSQLPKPE